MRWKPWVLILGTSVLAVVVFAFFSMTAWRAQKDFTPAAAQPSTPPKIDQPLVSFVDPSQGPANAPVTIVMYSDYFCPYCRAAELDLQKAMAAYPNRVRFVWKDMPNPVHAGAEVAAEAAQCAKAQGKFWEYHNQLINDPSAQNQASLTLLANEQNLDVTKFSNCLSNQDMAPLVARDVAEAQALGVDGTPYFFINGKRVSGQMSYDQFVEAIRP